MALFVEFRFFSLFFFPKKFPKILFFFFSQEKITRHSLTQISGPGKKNTAPEKKTSFLLTHSIFPKNVQILIFSGEIKKYGTFA